MISVVIPKLVRYFLLIFLTVLWSACNILQNKSDNTLSEEDYLKFTEVFHQAGIQRMLGKTDSAHVLYQKAVEINPKSSAAHYYSGLLFYHKERYYAALSHIESALAQEPNNLWYNFLKASSLRHINDYKEAEKTYRFLAENYSGASFVHKDLIDLYIRDNAHKKAVEAYHTYAEKKGFDLNYALKIYREIGKDYKLKIDFLNFLRSSGDTLRFDMLKAETFTDAGMTDQAEKIYKRYYQSSTADENVLITLYSYYYYYTDKTSVINDLEKRILHSSADPQIKYQIAAEQAKNDSSLYKKTVLQLFEQYPGHPKIGKSAGDIFFNKESYASAFNAYKSAYREEKSDFKIINNLLLSAERICDYQSTEQYADTALMYMPNRAELYLFSGTGALYTKNFSKAREMFETGLAYVFDERLNNRFSYYQALLLYAQEDFKKTVDLLRKIGNDPVMGTKAEALKLLSKSEINGEYTDALNRINALKSELSDHAFCKFKVVLLYKAQGKEKALRFIEECGLTKNACGSRLSEQLEQNVTIPIP